MSLHSNLDAHLENKYPWADSDFGLEYYFPFNQGSLEKSQFFVKARKLEWEPRGNKKTEMQRGDQAESLESVIVAHRISASRFKMRKPKHP